MAALSLPVLSPDQQNKRSVFGGRTLVSCSRQEGVLVLRRRVYWFYQMLAMVSSREGRGETLKWKEPGWSVLSMLPGRF